MDRDPNEAKERSDPGGPRQTAWQWQANSSRKEELGVWGGVGGPGQREGLHFSLGGPGFILRVWGPEARSMGVLWRGA